MLCSGSDDNTVKVPLVDGWMDGWMDGWLDGWVDGWINDCGIS